MAYVNPVGYYNQVHEEAVASVEQQHDSYIMVAKDHLENSQLNYRVEIKFPTTGLLSTLSPFERGALEQQVYDAIAAKAAEYDNMATFNATVEAEGLQVLVEAMEQLMDGTFGMAGALEKAGFDRLPVGPGGTLERSQNDIDENLDDYAGLKIIPDVGNSILFRDLMGQASLPGSLTKRCVFTDNYNTSAELNEASSAFEGANEHLVLWIHFVDEDGVDNDSIYIKSKNNLTLAEAQAAMETFYVKSNWDDPLTENGATAQEGGEENINRSVSGGDCSFGGSFGKRCLLTANSSFGEGLAIGLFDGLLDVLYMCYDTGKSIGDSVKDFFFGTWDYAQELWNHYWKTNSMYEVLKKAGNDAMETIEANLEFAVEAFKLVREICVNIDPSSIIDNVKQSIIDWLGGLANGEPDQAYDVGIIIFNTISFAFGGGSVQISKFLPQLIEKVKYFGGEQTRAVVTDIIDIMKSKANNVAGLAKKIVKCKILGKGCFIAGTPVLVANKNYNNSSSPFRISNAKSLAVAAAMPIVAVPIQDVQLLDYAVAHETVNSTYGLTASTDDDIYLGLTDKDPYTSDQQRERDEYELDDENWYEVVFEELLGGSTAKLALHSDWIYQKGYQVDAVVEMNLPEQGISGPFRITSIKHILPQKRPEDEDAGKSFVFRPVTGIFIHQSNDVWTLKFDSGDTLGVTANHPIYSTTAQDWRLAGELAIGEQVLTHAGSATLTGKRPAPAQRVYNLEVQAVHNFLVAEVGVVVHNGCLIGEIIEEAAYWFKYKNFKGKILKIDKQNTAGIESSIGTAENLPDIPANIGKRLEANVARSVQEKKEVKGYGVKVQRENGTQAGDMDIVTENEIIEVKSKVNSVKVNQMKKYADIESDDFMNLNAKKVILYIDDVNTNPNHPVLQSVRELNMKDGIKVKVVIGSLEELKLNLK